MVRIFPFYNPKSAAEQYKKSVEIDRFSRRYPLWTLEEADEVYHVFLKVRKHLKDIKDGMFPHDFDWLVGKCIFLYDEMDEPKDFRPLEESVNEEM